MYCKEGTVISPTHFLLPYTGVNILAFKHKFSTAEEEFSVNYHLQKVSLLNLALAAANPVPWAMQDNV